MGREAQRKRWDEQAWRDPTFYAFALVGLILLCASLLCSAKAQTAQPALSIQVGYPGSDRTLEVNPVTPSDYRHAPELPSPLTF